MIARISHILRGKARRVGRFLLTHRLATAVILSVSGVALVLPQTTHGVFGWVANAVGSVIGDIGGGVVGWAAFEIGYIFASVVGILIGVAAYCINVVLQLNTHVVDAIAVQQGFKVTLSLANLGFVLAIIVIAIATIVRYESYGMKKVLWKLVVAALLVNFSLVIAGSIINFSDQLSGSFMSAFPGQQTGSTMTGDAWEKIKGFNSFASGLAGAFNPQRNWTFASLKESYSKTGAQGASLGGQGLAKLFVPIVQVIFTAVTSVFILFALLSLVVLLMIRYVYLGILLILMPLAWLLWIFPLTEKNWSKWWGKFIKWTFFAPITLFFLWLVILTSSAMSAKITDPSNTVSGLQALGYVPAGGEGLLADIGGLFGGFINQILGNFLQALILVALTIAGFFAANAMALETSKTAQKIMGSANNYIGRRMKQGGNAAYRRLGGPKLAGAMQRQGLGTLKNLGINRGPLLKMLAMPVRGAAKAIGALGGDYAAKLGGRGLQSFAAQGGRGLVAEGKKRVKKEFTDLSPEEQGNATRSMPMYDLIAALELMLNNKNGSTAHNADPNSWSEDKKAAFEGYGKGDLFEELRNAYPATTGVAREAAEKLADPWARVEETVGKVKAFNPDITPEQLAEVRDAAIKDEGIENIKVNDKDGKEVSALETLEKEMEEALGGTKKGDPLGHKVFYGDKPVLDLSVKSLNLMGYILAKKLPKVNSALVPEEIRSMNAKQYNKFEKVYKSSLQEEIARLGKDTPVGIEMGEKLKSFERILINRRQSAAPKEKESEEGSGEEQEGGHGAKSPFEFGGGGSEAHQ